MSRVDIDVMVDTARTVVVELRYHEKTSRSGGTLAGTVQLE